MGDVRGPGPGFGSCSPSGQRSQNLPGRLCAIVLSNYCNRKISRTHARSAGTGRCLKTEKGHDGPLCAAGLLLFSPWTISRDEGNEISLGQRPSLARTRHSLRKGTHCRSLKPALH